MWSAKSEPGTSQIRGLLTGMIGAEPINPGFEEALFPAADGVSTGLQSALNGVEGGAFGQHRDELGAKDVARRQGPRLSKPPPNAAHC